MDEKTERELAEARERNARRLAGEASVPPPPRGDFTKTLLCAKAMGFEFRAVGDYAVQVPNPLWKVDVSAYPLDWHVYDPLHDDAQAMALLKRFRLSVTGHEAGQDRWVVGSFVPFGESAEDIVASSDDLNRAIVECVAKMQAASSPREEG